MEQGNFPKYNGLLSDANQQKKALADGSSQGEKMSTEIFIGPNVISFINQFIILQRFS